MSAAEPNYPASFYSRLFNITERRVQQMAQQGIVPKAARGKYPLVGTIQAYVKFLQERALGGETGPTDLHTEKTKLTAAQREKMEIEVAVTRGELVYADQVADAWALEVTDCKQRLLSVASKAAPIVAAEDNSGACMEIIDALVREALQELSDDVR